MDIVTRRNLLAVLAASPVFSSIGGCQSTNQERVEPSEPSRARVGANISRSTVAQFIPSFYFGDRNAPNTVDFFWSPTCLPSAKFFGNVILPLSKGADKKFNCYFYALARHKGDLELIVAMRLNSHRDFAVECLSGMSRSYRLQKGFNTSELRPYIKNRRSSYSDAQVADNYYIQLAFNKFCTENLALSETPSIFINGHKSAGINSVSDLIAAA